MSFVIFGSMLIGTCVILAELIRDRAHNSMRKIHRNKKENNKLRNMFETSNQKQCDDESKRTIHGWAIAKKQIERYRDEEGGKGGRERKQKPCPKNDEKKKIVQQMFKFKSRLIVGRKLAENQMNNKN